MPLYQWTSIGPERRDRDIGEEAIKPTKDIKDESPHSESRDNTDPPTVTLHRREHVSSADKWDTLPETAREERRRRASTSSTTTTTTSQLTFHQPLYRGITWPR